MLSLSTKLLTVLVVEDELLYAEQLEVMLKRLGYRCLGPAIDAPTSLALIVEHGWPDLILLDIKLRTPLDGIELGTQLLAAHPLPLIFLTSSADPETFVRASRLAPAAYLIKPVTPDALQRAIELAIINFAAAQSPSNVELDSPSNSIASNSGFLLSEALFVKIDGLLTKVLISSIQWVQADGKYCQLALASQLVQVRQPLRELIHLLPPQQFIQIQRSYLVNINHIDRIDPVNNLVLVADQLLPLGLTYRDELLRRLRIA
jgi:DNA-binding LytR/AlgR family response regulator